MINQYGKFGLAGLVKLAGCETSECQLSGELILSDEEKIYSDSQPLLILCLASLPLEFNKNKKSIINIVENIKGNISEIGDDFARVEHNIFTPIRNNITTRDFVKEIFCFLSISSMEIMCFWVIGIYFLSIKELVKNTLMNHVITNNIVDEIVATKKSLLAKEKESKLMQKIVNDIRDANVFILLISILIFSASKFLIKCPIKKITHLLIITSYLASRSEYARK